MNTISTSCPGEKTTVTIKHGHGDPIMIEGLVVYVEPAIGFPVDFA